MTGFTITVEGANGADEAFEQKLSEAVAGEVEREGAELSAANLAIDTFQFIVDHKDGVLAGIMIVDKLIELAAKFKTKLWVTHAGTSVPVDAEHRAAAAQVIDRTRIDGAAANAR